jgi:hypothetical protein
MVFFDDFHPSMGENKSFRIKGSKVSIVIGALKKEIHHDEETECYFDPTPHPLSCHFLCPGKDI